MESHIVENSRCFYLFLRHIRKSIRNFIQKLFLRKCSIFFPCKIFPRYYLSFLLLNTKGFQSWKKNSKKNSKFWRTKIIPKISKCLFEKKTLLNLRKIKKLSSFCRNSVVIFSIRNIFSVTYETNNVIRATEHVLLVRVLGIKWAHAWRDYAFVKAIAIDFCATSVQANYMAMLFEWCRVFERSKVSEPNRDITARVYRWNVFGVGMTKLV